MRFEVRTHDDAVRRAYERLLPEQSDLIKSGKLDWKFNHSPGGQGVAVIAAEETDLNAPLGLIGFAPSKLKIGARFVQAFQAMDTIVHPDARGRGLFSALGSAFYAERSRFDAQILYGFPNDNAAPGWFNKLQWSRLGTPPFLIKPLRAGYFAGRINDRLRNLFNFPLTLPVERKHHRDAVRIDLFDQRVDALWDAFSRDIGCSIHRDHAFLNWRLFSHPTESYDTQAIYRDDGSLSAFVSTTSSHKHGGKIGYVMEAMALPGAEGDLRSLLMKSALEMYRAGVDAILAWSAPHAPNYQAYRRSGFYPIPERIRPIQLYFGGRALDPSLSSVMNSQSDWYLSYLDSDTV